MKQEKKAIEELYKEAESATIGTLAEMIKMFKTKTTVEKKDKEKSVKIIWATTHRFSATEVDDDGVAMDGRTKTVGLALLLCKAFQIMKFDKSMSGPPPSVVEKSWGNS